MKDGEKPCLNCDAKMYETLVGLWTCDRCWFSLMFPALVDGRLQFRTSPSGPDWEYLPKGCLLVINDKEEA